MKKTVTIVLVVFLFLLSLQVTALASEESAAYPTKDAAYMAAPITNDALLRQRALAGIDERSAAAKEAGDIQAVILLSEGSDFLPSAAHCTTQLLERSMDNGVVKESYVTTAVASTRSSKTNHEEMGNVLDVFVTINWRWYYDDGVGQIRQYQFINSTHRYALSGSTTVYSMTAENRVYQPGNLPYDNSQYISSPISDRVYSLDGADYSVYPGGDGHGYAAKTTVNTAAGSIAAEVSFATAP